MTAKRPERKTLMDLLLDADAESPDVLARKVDALYGAEVKRLNDIIDRASRMCETGYPAMIQQILQERRNEGPGGEQAAAKLRLEELNKLVAAIASSTERLKQAAIKSPTRVDDALAGEIAHLELLMRHNR